MLRTAGTSLVEVLIVIVIFLIGILAVAQIFPGGFRVLANNRNMTQAGYIAAAYDRSLAGLSSHIPEYISAVSYTSSGANVAINSDPTVSSQGLNPNGAVDLNGNLLDSASNILGPWKLLTASNTMRHVVGESARVPAPTQIGALYGGPFILQFGPPIPAGGTYLTGLDVYGNDLRRVDGTPAPSGNQPYEYFVDSPNDDQGKIYLEADPALTRDYRISVSAYLQNGGNTYRRDFVGLTVTVPAMAGYQAITLNTLLPTGAEVLKSIVLDTVRVQRKYRPVAAYSSDPYEYVLLDPNIGVLLFNPVGYTSFVRDAEGNRVPLLARVSYDVFDWRILHDEFRVSSDPVPQYKLMIGNLKVKGHSDVDGLPYNGLEIPVPDGRGATEQRDIVFVDLVTGGIILENSGTRNDGANPKRLVKIDKSLGLLTFVDADGNAANGVQGELVLPGTTTPVDINLAGRSIRALYRANGEWSVQVLKAASSYAVAAGRPSIEQYYVGGSDGAVGGGATRIYFPAGDVGQKVTIGQIHYLRTGDVAPRTMEDQTFEIQGTPADPFGLPYIDITAVDPAAVSFEFNTFGYAARDVRGASMTVRVLWNPDFLTLSGNNADNQKSLDKWARGWRRTTQEDYALRGGA